MNINNDIQTALAKPAAPTTELDVRRGPGGYPAYSRYPSIEVEKNSLREYWRVVRGHKWLILTTVVVLVTVVTIGTLLMRPVYRAEVKVEIGKEIEKVMPGQQIMNTESANVFNPLFLQTQVDILHSRDLARRVIQQLNLTESEEFKAKSAGGPGMGEAERETRLVNAFQSRYDVSVGRLSRVISISFDAYNPQLAKEVANSAANEYIAWTMENRGSGLAAAKTFLEKRVREAEGELHKSESAFQQYAAKHRIITLDDKNNITVERAAELNRQLVQVQNERRAAEALYQQSLMVTAEELPEVLNNPTVQNLSKELSKQEQELAHLSERYQPTYPAVKQVQGQITQLKAQLETAKQRIVKNIKTQYQVARKREESLIASFGESKNQAIAENRETIELNTLRQKLETDRKIYDELLQQLVRAGVESSFQPSNIRVVQSAEVPIAPIKPNKPLNIGLALVVGLALGIGLAFFLEYLDNTINTSEDVERIVHLPPLGAIPSLQSLAKRRLFTGQASSATALARARSAELLSQHESRSSFAEAYRALRTSLLLSSAEHAPRTMLVTSSHPAEGKTTIVANTAISLAQTGARVLVLDADMRRPRCHKILSLKNEAGLSNYLSRETPLERVIQEHEIPNLYVLTAGPVPPNPSELLSSPKLRALLEELRDKFDHVVIDSPPVINVTDALIISTSVDGVVLVVKSGHTPREAVLRAKQALADVNAKVFGVVLNGIDLDAESYYYNYKYSYYNSYEEPSPGA